jgi:hypothetical protein
MKKLYFILLLSLLLGSCGGEPAERMVIPTGGFDRTESMAASVPVFGRAETAQTQEPEQLSAFDFNPTGELLNIVWCYFWPDVRQSMAMRHPENEPIAELINERFNVVITSELNAGRTPPNYLKRYEDGNSYPDIIQPHYQFRELIEAGAMREIPWDMVKRFAPRYAEMYGEPGNRNVPVQFRPFEPYFLLGMVKPVEMLTQYSVYRLDWLEQVGVFPKGNLVELQDGIYFTDESFTSDEFLDIMRRFSGLEAPKRKAMSIIGGMTSEVANLMGMFGINTSNVLEDGKAVMAQAGNGYRQFLFFMENLADMGVIRLHRQQEAQGLRYENNVVGWWTEELDELFRILENRRQVHAQGFDSFMPGKLLITPPEIGTDGRQGTFASKDFTRDFYIDSFKSFYTIGAHVSDEKLARILMIFDALSFEPELHVLSKFGVEGTDFEWTGEPYNSMALVDPLSNAYIGTRPGISIFNTGVMDEVAGKAMFAFPSREMYDYATSPDALRLLIPPYKSDPFGELADELAAHYTRYHGTESIYSIISEYFNDILSGKKSVANTWDDYINRLKAAGLDEITELINKYPVTAK